MSITRSALFLLTKEIIATLIKLQRALEAAHVDFTDENGGGLGVRVTKAASQEELGGEGKLGTPSGQR